MTGSSPSNNENRQSPLAPFSKGGDACLLVGRGEFGSYFLSNSAKEDKKNSVKLRER
jgi:hypothetical protein